MTRILLVTPAFHGYWRAVAAALERRGHAVVAHVYDDNATLQRKIRHQVRYELPNRVREGSGINRQRLDATKQAIRALEAHSPHVVLAIRADVIDPLFWEAAHGQGACTTLWLYDEVQRMHYSVEDLRHPEQLVTYSRRDQTELTAQGLDVTYLLNAYDPSFAISPLPSDEIVFIGARYPDREAVLQTLHDAGIPIRAYGRQWSHHWLDRLRTWDLRRPGIPAERDVDRATAYNVMAGAAGAINMHTEQDGFTMRTFEIPGSGGLQLIDRPDVSDLYEPGSEVLVYSGADELADLCRRARREPEWAREIGRRARARTLAEHTFDHRMHVLCELWGLE
jgi:spore maturation protein CgeB